MLLLGPLSQHRTITEEPGLSGEVLSHSYDHLEPLKTPLPLFITLTLGHCSGSIPDWIITLPASLLH